jgi:hypothetical protein
MYWLKKNIPINAISEAELLFVDETTVSLHPPLRRCWMKHGQRKLAPGLQTPHHAAKLDAEQVKGHFNDHGHPVLQQYRERLRRYHIEDVTLPLAGD